MIVFSFGVLQDKVIVQIVLVNNELYSIRIVLVSFGKTTYILFEGLMLVRKTTRIVKKSYLVDLVIILPIRTLLFAKLPSNAIN